MLGSGNRGAVRLSKKQWDSEPRTEPWFLSGAFLFGRGVRLVRGTCTPMARVEEVAGDRLDPRCGRGGTGTMMTIWGEGDEE
jgi:hypothetical protein